MVPFNNKSLYQISWHVERYTHLEKEKRIKEEGGKAIAIKSAGTFIIHLEQIRNKPTEILGTRRDTLVFSANTILLDLTMLTPSSHSSTTTTHKSVDSTKNMTISDAY
jgi:hypothetical protein